MEYNTNKQANIDAGKFKKPHQYTKNYKQLINASFSDSIFVREFFVALNSAFIFGKCHSKTIQMTFLSLFISWTEGWFERYSLISGFGPSHSSTFFFEQCHELKVFQLTCPPLLINLKWIPHHYVFLFNDLQFHGCNNSFPCRDIVLLN